MGFFSLNLHGSPVNANCSGPTRTIGLLGVLCVSVTLAVQSSAWAQFGSERSSHANAPNWQQPKQGRASKVIPVILREGTQVGPIRGRFVLRGQRWTFLVDGGSPDPADVSELIDGGVARKTEAELSSVLGRHHAGDERSGNASGTYAKDTASSFDSIGRADGFGGNRPPSLRLNAFDQMIVLENLMLGRIAAAIKLDPDDDVWSITARVTEFEDQNRLLLITAHRAAASR